MRETFELLKMNAINSANTGKTKGKLGKTFLSLLFCMFFITAFTAAMSICEFFRTEEINSYYLVFPAMIGLGMIYMLLITTYKAKGVLFGFRDIDLLFSMPIKESSILSYKIIDMMTFNYLISFMLFAPTVIVYAMYEHVENVPMYLLFAAVVLIFIPLTPTLLSGIFGYIIGYISAKSKHKSIVELITSISIILVYIQISSSLGDFLQTILETQTDLEHFMQDVFFPLYWAQDAMANQNAMSLLLFALFNIISFGIFVFIIKKSFTNINRRMKESISSKNFKMSELKEDKPLMALFKKEFGLYTKSATYMLNTCFGTVCMIILSVSSIFSDPNTLLTSTLETANVGFELTGTQLLAMLCGTMAMLSCTTADSISMESKALWVTKEMPATEMEIFMGKMLVDLGVILPLNLLSTIILTLTFKIPVVDALLIYVLVIAAGVTMTQFGLLLNLKYPKLSFNAETEVVKESMSARLAVYIPLALMFVISFIYMLVQISLVIYLCIVDAAFIAAAVLMNIIVKTKGIRTFKELYC